MKVIIASMGALALWSFSFYWGLLRHPKKEEKNRYQGITQLGQSSRSGAEMPLVKIQPPRPFLRYARWTLPVG